MRKLPAFIMVATLCASLICGCSSTVTTKTKNEAEGTTEEYVTETITTVENAVFTISYNADLFEEEEDEDDSNVRYFDYLGDAAHSVYLQIEYDDQDPETLADSARGVEGMTILSDEQVQPSFWSEPVTCIQETSDEGDHTATYTIYFLPYGDGTMTVAAVGYEEEDEALAEQINDDMEELINSLEFK